MKILLIIFPIFIELQSWLNKIILSFEGDDGRTEGGLVLVEGEGRWGREKEEEKEEGWIIFGFIYSPSGKKRRRKGKESREGGETERPHLPRSTKKKTLTYYDMHTCPKKKRNFIKPWGGMILNIYRSKQCMEEESLYQNPTLRKN